MGFGTIEIVLILVIALIWFVYFQKPENKTKIEKGKKTWEENKKHFKSAISSVKEVEFDLRDTIEDVETEIKRKRKNEN